MEQHKSPRKDYPIPELFIPITIPVPPMLEETVGYDGKAQFVAFFWTPAGDEAMYSDGFLSADGDWTAFLTFRNHSAVYPALQRYNLGSSEEDAEYWLVLDRNNRVCYVTPAQEAENFLSKQWEEKLWRVTDEDMEELMERWKHIPMPSIEDVQAVLARNQQRVSAMKQWLDQALAT